jgi:hypothetical protein
MFNLETVYGCHQQVCRNAAEICERMMNAGEQFASQAIMSQTLMNKEWVDGASDNPKHTKSKLVYSGIFVL